MRNKVAMRVLAAISTLAMVFGTVFAGGEPMKAEAAEQYELVWSDEFDGNTLNRNNWNVEVNGYGGWNNELQYYLDSPNNIVVNNGTLKIIARKERYQDKDYTSARLNSQNKVSLGLGKIEARMKLPSFMGAWPAFWLMGSNGQQWPNCGEIDILETINNENIVYGSAHWPSSTPGKANDSASGGTYGRYIDITQWHTYGIERDADKIVWYIDDYKYSTVSLTDNANKAPLTIDQYILLNLAIGGNWPGFNIDDSAIPATMEVDYVRYYKRIDTGSTPGSDIPSNVGYKDLVAESASTFSGAVGSWAGSAGTISAKNPATAGFVADLTAIGNDMWGAQASLVNLNYTPGQTYTFRSTLTSSVDKKVFVKIEGDDHAEIAVDTLNLKANQPYAYERSVTIPSGYNGAVSLFYAFGGGFDGEYNSAGSGLRLEVKNVYFFTGKTDAPETESPETEIPDPDDQGTGTPHTDEPATEVPDTDKPDTEVPHTDEPSTETPDTDVHGGDEVAGVDKWNANAVYTKGSRVSYNGKVYEASWWTQGTNPEQQGVWGPWKLVGNAVVDNDNGQQTSPVVGVPAWDPSKVYYGGEKVSYNGKVYKANWWTQGTNPEQQGAWGPWSLVG
ncbi:MAG: family 16 glycosylhydrolase [Lachnospiraceae bacterium]|nr:family 16 glycosylhydrolase [Lachnospiraceae bacterium]